MIPLKVDYKNFEAHPDLNPLIQEQTIKLEKYFDRITSCHVVVSRPHQHHVNGNVYHVHIELHIPGNNIAITKESERDIRHDNPSVAIRDAFKSASRKLQDYADILRNDIKAHNLINSI